MYLNTVRDGLKVKAVYSVQEGLLKTVKECREEATHTPLAKEFLLLGTGQSVKLNSVALNTPLVKLYNEKSLPCILTFLGYAFPISSGPSCAGFLSSVFKMIRVAPLWNS